MRFTVKKLWAKLASLACVATVCLTVTSVAVKANAAAATDLPDNYGAYIVASGEILGGDGWTTYYTKIGDGNGVMTFDLLSANKFGYFGLICGDSSQVNDLNALKDYALFGKGVKTTLDLGSIDFAFTAGHTYRATFNASGKKLSLEEKDVDKGDDAYALIFEANTTFTKSNVIGMAALSDGTSSATVIIDNLSISDLKGKTAYVNNSFDNGATVKDGSMKIGVYNTQTKETSKIGSVYLHKDALCTIRFVDESGNLIATQKVCLYGNAGSPVAPEKEGLEHIGWSESLIGIRKDMTVYPIYGVPADPVTPPDDNPPDEKPDDNPSDKTDEETKGGCGGILSAASGFVSVLAVSGVAVALKRRENR